MKLLHILSTQEGRGSKGKCFWVNDITFRNQLESRGADESVILKNPSQESGLCACDSLFGLRIERWMEFMTTIMKFHISYKVGFVYRN